MLVLLARIVLSWFPISRGSPVEPIATVLYALTEPVLGPLRRAIPPVRIGAMGLDLSPLIVLFGVNILMGIIC
ncbi:YggT family protein [Actinomarinicola tropica]|uniref:YggT family protein n=2 Tax=Actinomarinicola tropica TaxID=2789776 RepID=A0A5Q2RMK0_9ACTN|nr:YggT family protein [Actinomarinicola tropica]